MNCRELFQYICKPHNLHDYVWGRLKELGYETGRNVTYTDEMKRLQRGHARIDQRGPPGHTYSLGKHLCDEHIFKNFDDRLRFYEGLTLGGRPEHNLDNIYLVAKLSEKLMEDKELDNIDRLIEEVSRRFSYYNTLEPLCSY